MTWLDLYRKLKGQTNLNPEELALVEGQARAEVDEIFAPVPVAAPSQPNGSNGHRKPRNKHTIMACSTSRASIIPLRDWRVVADAAQELGISVKMVEALVDEGPLDRIMFDKGPDLIHIRQVAYYIEHHQVLEVDSHVFDGWERQRLVAYTHDIPEWVISKWNAAGTIAVYKPQRNLVLVNEAEVLRQWRQEQAISKK